MTWVFDVSSNCAVDPWTVVFGNAPGDGRRLPVRRTSRYAFPPSFIEGSDTK